MKKFSMKYSKKLNLGRIITSGSREISSILGDIKEEYHDLRLENNKILAFFQLLKLIIRALPSLITLRIIWSSAMFKNNLKIAYRSLKRHLGFSLINIFGLSAGLACTIILMLFVQDELSFDSMHKNKDRIYRVLYNQKQNGKETIYNMNRAPLTVYLKENFSDIEESFRIFGTGRTSIEYGDLLYYEGEHIVAEESFFKIFDFELEQGDKSTALTEANSVILSKETAKKIFGNDDPMGKSIKVSMFENFGETVVTGVFEEIPDNSHLQFSMVFPLKALKRFVKDLDTNWGRFGVQSYVMLNENANIDQVRAKIPSIYKDINTSNPANANDEIIFQSMNDIHFESADILFDRNWKKGEKQYVYIISITAFIILFIACFNFMNLSTARSADRAKEIGMRKVVGANRAQLIKQILSESMFIIGISAAFSLVLAVLIMPYFNELSNKELAIGTLLNPVSILSVSALILFIGLMAGSYPAFILSAFNPITAIQSKKMKSGGSAAFRKLLVIGQFAMAIIMILATLTVTEQLNYMRNKNIGLNKDQILTLEINSGNVRKNWKVMEDKFRQLPTIKNVSITSKTPFGRQRINSNAFKPEGHENMEGNNFKSFTIDDNFINLYEVNILNGRNVSKLQNYENSALINEAAVKFIGWDDPIGKKIVRSGSNKEYTIVGVTEDYHYESLHADIAPLVMYVQDQSMDYISFKIVPSNISQTLEQVAEIYNVHDVNPAEFKFVDETFANLYKNDEKMGTIFSNAAFLAILISCLGLFGLTLYTVETRTKEIGIRKILGASMGSVMLLLVKDFAIWIALSILVAWPVGYLLMSKWLENFAYRIQVGPYILLSSGLIITLIAILTISYQAIKAANIQPVNSLRYE